MCECGVCLLFLALLHPLHPSFALSTFQLSPSDSLLRPGFHPVLPLLRFPRRLPRFPAAPSEEVERDDALPLKALNARTVPRATVLALNAETSLRRATLGDSLPSLSFSVLVFSPVCPRAIRTRVGIGAL